MKWFLKVLWHYADFSGRARRKEFWLFVLFGYIFLIAWSSLLILIFRLTEITDGETLAFVPFFSSFYFLAAMLLPVMAVIVRRLHDTGKSGWWILIGLIPGGVILLFAWMTIKGQYFTNRYGQDPKRSAEKSGG
ncbi:MAG: DUF805 domain-containing protein [Tannerella sp.]|jgi:uncharacterized membrane protein YhaH (DUF805 family)|nr:DUF805 domain-containing protein [Tannerella sp.]